MSQRLDQFLTQYLVQKPCNGSVPTFKSYIICDNTLDYKLDSQNSSTHNYEEQINSLRRPTIIKSKTDQLKRKEAPPRPPPPKSGPTFKSTNIFVKPATSQKNDYQAELETIYNTEKEINKNLDKSSFLKENDTVTSSPVPKPAFHYSKKGHASLHFPRNVDDGITSSTFTGQDDHTLSVSGTCKSSVLVDSSALSCLIPKPKTRTSYNQKEESQENLLDISDTYNINEYSLLEGTNTKLQVSFHSGNVLPENKLTTPRSFTCFPKDTSGSCASPCEKNNESHLSHSNVAQLENRFSVSNIPREVPNESKTSKLNVNSYQGVRSPVPVSFESSSTVWQASLDTKAKEERSLLQTVPSARTSTKEEKSFQHISSLTTPQDPLSTMHNVHYGNLNTKNDFNLSLPWPENAMNSVTLRKCKAVYSFKGENPDELTFKEGDVIIFEEKINEDWWKGNLGDQQGIFPSSYVVMEDTDDFNSTNVNTREGLATCIVVALYDFEEGDEGDLSFKKGDKIKVIARINKDWLYGEIQGLRGQFPESFVYKPSQEALGLPVGKVYFARYSFKGENSNELTFNKSETILCTGIVNTDWWQGKLVKDPMGKEGMFPSSFVEIMV